MRGPPDARDIGSCRCVAERRENGWGLIEEAPNHLPQCCRPSEIFAKLISAEALRSLMKAASLSALSAGSSTRESPSTFTC